MKCPHCLENFHEEMEKDFLGKDVTYVWSVSHQNCPACEKRIVILNGKSHIRNIEDVSFLAFPRGIARSPIPDEVDDFVLVTMYNEACNVLLDSPQASAALSRIALQHILREKIGVKNQELSKEIQEVIDNNKLPRDISENLDAIRSIGNFAAHPTKSQSSGEIFEVEPGEAEWNLDVLEELIEWAYVRPLKMKEKKEKLNEKLRDAGKPEIL